MFRVIEPNKSNNDTLTILGYEMEPLRKHILCKVADVVSGRSKGEKFALPNYPQIYTVLGEVKAMFPNKLTFNVSVNTDDLDFGETVIITVGRK